MTFKVVWPGPECRPRPPPRGRAPARPQRQGGWRAPWRWPGRARWTLEALQIVQTDRGFQAGRVWTAPFWKEISIVSRISLLRAILSQCLYGGNLYIYSLTAMIPCGFWDKSNSSNSPFHHGATVFTQTSQELRMLSSVTINCQITKIVMNSGSQLSEL